MPLSPKLFLPLLLLVGSALRTEAQTVAAGDAEATRCLEQLAAVRRDLLGKYEDQLAEMQQQFQKAADLENALAVRDELRRVRDEKTLAEANFVSGPKGLRALQQQTVAKMEELCAGVVSEVIPRLVELKKALTVEGQLDDAVKIRTWIEKLQNDHVPIARPSPGELVHAETLLTAYAADRSRADKTYKDAKFTVRGTLVAYRLDPNDPRRCTLYLGKPGNIGWIGCFFEGSVRFREDKAFNSATLVVSHPSGGPLIRWQTGQSIEVQGTCVGFEDVVRLSRCELPN